VVAATNLLYHFPPLMVALGTVAVRPELVPESVITRDVFRSLMVRPEIVAQSVHFALASLAVSGLAVMLVVARRRRSLQSQSAETNFTADADRAGRLIRAGAMIALAASLVQLVVGVWVLLELPLRVRHALIGDDWLATGLFFAAIVGTFGLLHALAVAGLGETSDGSVRRCAALMLAVTVLMTGVLETARHAERATSISIVRGPSAVVSSQVDSTHK
jgi:hypothetical protein